MKIRQGFVSNSSSSSFALIGRTIKFNEIEKYIKNNDNVIIMMYGDEGTTIVEINSMIMLAHILAYFELVEIKIENCYVSYSSTFDNSRVDLTKIPKSGKVEIISETVQSYSVHNMNDLKEYFEYDDVKWEDVEKLSKTIIRREKLKEIEK